ncbi:hypothetical protein AAG570_009780 [Ranatra chinensis]|uniref:Uncharacterized protein n=1 Tax=Ranatra chinensis TaxID=642074 RepID=A0ABD0YQC0_9HEMI
MSHTGLSDILDIALVKGTNFDITLEVINDLNSDHLPVVMNLDGRFLTEHTFLEYRNRVKELHGSDLWRETWRVTRRYARLPAFVENGQNITKPEDKAELFSRNLETDGLPIKYVIRGVDDETLSEELLAELKSEGFPVIRVVQLKSTGDKRKLPLFLTRMETQAPTQMTVDVNTVSGLAMTAILNMPEFTGDPERLTDFLEAATAAGAHLRSVNALLPPEVVNIIYSILIRKIPHQVIAESGITGSKEAAEVARLLSERYGGARTPASQTVKDEDFRLVKARMAAVEAAGVATAKLAVIEELPREAVLSEMPEMIRRQLKALNNANFGVLLAQEDDYQAAKEDAATWTRVERRSERRPDRGSERRAPPNPPHQAGPARKRPSSSTGAYVGECREGPQERPPRGKNLERVGRFDRKLQLGVRLYFRRGLARASSADAATG